MKTVSFSGLCDALSSKVLVSPRIARRFILKGIDARFAVGCENKLKLRFYYSRDDEAPTSGEPSGVSMLSDYGQVDYIVGDQDSKYLLHEVEVEEAGSYLKVYAVNDDYYDHAVDVQMYIEPMESEA
jgi:hypothetical protein